MLGRENNLKQIKQIGEQAKLPMEVFVHGALCVSYSGQCLTSEMWGGRSANRGECAQACRLPYDLMVDGVQKPMGDVAYLLSPKDLAAIDLVPELIEAGVTFVQNRRAAEEPGICGECGEQIPHGDRQYFDGDGCRAVEGRDAGAAAELLARLHARVSEGHEQQAARGGHVSEKPRRLSGPREASVCAMRSSASWKRR